MVRLKGGRTILEQKHVYYATDVRLWAVMGWRGKFDEWLLGSNLLRYRKKRGEVIQIPVRFQKLSLGK